MKEFPTDFLFGAATASLQIEGGDRNNSWYDWCEAGKIPNGDHCIVANDHWNRIEEDVQCMKDLHLNTYRMSIEWSRIQPSPQTWDESAMIHYENEIDALLEAGIEPMVTLHHFSNPSWFENEGAWLQKDADEMFVKYVEYVVDRLKGKVRLWVTINEPNVYLIMGYFMGLFPPGIKGSIRSYLKGARSMIKSHCKAYELIHEMYQDVDIHPQVGAALHLRLFDPIKPSWLGNLSRRICYHLFQDMFYDGMLSGKCLGPKKKHDRYFDYLGINYYTRDILVPKLGAFPIFADVRVKEGAPTNDLNWEIYPEGLARVIRRYYARSEMPIYITENGIADAQDAQRKAYIKDHLQAVLDCIKEGIPVRGYYHWTLMDNFEWMEGYEARFGLYHHEVESQKRSLRESGAYYAQVCKSLKID